MTLVDALQTTLAAEHGTVYVLAYLGAQTSTSARPDLASAIAEAYAVHRDRRDALESTLREAGAEPVASEAAYDLPDLSDRGSQAIPRAALDLERACGVAYDYLVANSTAAGRRWALEALLDSATRELDFGGRPRPLPGQG